MTHVLRRALALVVPLAIVVTIAGCGKKNIGDLLKPSNELPIVRVTAAPIDTNAVCHPDPARSCYSLTLDWVGYDPDGRIDHYIYAVDPPDPRAGDTLWISTTDNEKRLVFTAPKLGPPTGPDSLSLLRGFHTFVIAAVDNQGATGPRVFRSFFSFTEAPTVSITDPRPTISSRILPPSIRITWTGEDQDGVFTSKPVRYKYLLLGPNDSDLITAIRGSQGAELRTRFAPDFPASAGWIATSGDSTTVQFTNLIPGAEYLFAVVAFDEAGAFSPVFGLDSNVLRFSVGYAAAFGPSITIFNESFFKKYPPNYVPSPLTEARIEAPAGQQLAFFWLAQAPEGASIVGIRWMLDGDVFDETPRTDEQTDTRHWSTPTSQNPGSATIGPFASGDHFFYVDAQDNTGLRSLATVHFNVVQATFERSLLIVDDTRYRPDQFRANGDLIDPQIAWPGAAELDTFLYAVGGVPWEKYPIDPNTGTNILSPPGVLSAYGTAGKPTVPSTYDTLGTRIGIVDIGVPLATLGHYQHVIWMVDYEGGAYPGAGNLPSQPTTALRFMSNDGHLNTLAAYLRQGGQAWLMGGGGAVATLSPHNVPGNDGGSRLVFDVQNHTSPFELQPGRFMFDVPKWQNRIYADKAVGFALAQRYLGRFRSRPGPYATLPAKLELRTTTSDPLPPKRTNSLYYNTTASMEYLAPDAPNEIQESVNGDPSDFKLDAFDDTVATAIKARWISTDTLNTVVGQAAVGSAGGSRASGRAMTITTQGGVASVGDSITHDLGSDHDFSGLQFLNLTIKQTQGTGSVQWRVRIIDAAGNSESALIPVATVNVYNDVSIPATAFTVDSPGLPGSTTPGTPPRLEHMQAIQFQLVRGDVAATTTIDALQVITLPAASTLDTLMVAQGSGLATAHTGDDGHDPIAPATMTYYHGHDFVKPFLFSGFGPWQFQRAECKQLFDFVLQKLWDIQPNGGTILSRRRAGSPALSVRPLRVPAAGAPSSGRGLRRTVGSSGLRTAPGAAPVRPGQSGR